MLSNRNTFYGPAKTAISLRRRGVTLRDLPGVTRHYIYQKYGYDDFVLQLANRFISSDSKSIQACMNLPNYYNILGNNIELQYKRLDVTRPYDFQEDQELRYIARKAIELDGLITNMGYAEMPPEMYSK